jgi:hypothetical protein
VNKKRAKLPESANKKAVWFATKRATKKEACAKKSGTKKGRQDTFD